MLSLFRFDFWTSDELKARAGREKLLTILLQKLRDCEKFYALSKFIAFLLLLRSQKDFLEFIENFIRDPSLFSFCIAMSVSMEYFLFTFIHRLSI